MPPEILSDLLTCQKITANIARKRQEGLITKKLRGLEEDEVMPIQRAVESIQKGLGLAQTASGVTVEPEVDAMAMQWRDRLLAGDMELQSDIFGMLQQRESGAWDFTRQELGQMVTTMRRDKEVSEAARAAAAAAAAAEAAEQAVMEDGSLVPLNTAGTAGMLTGKQKKSGSKAGLYARSHFGSTRGTHSSPGPFT